MTITKEKILERLKLLEQDRQTLISRVNAYDGAIEESRRWLSVLEEEDQDDAQS